MQRVSSADRVGAEGKLEAVQVQTKQDEKSNKAGYHRLIVPQIEGPDFHGP